MNIQINVVFILYNFMTPKSYTFCLKIPEYISYHLCEYMGGPSFMGAPMQ